MKRLRLRRHHGGHALDDHIAVLVGHHGLQLEAIFLLNALHHSGSSGDGVADKDGLDKLQLLAHVDGAGAGQVVAQHVGDEAGGEHTVGDALAEHAGSSLHGIHVSWVEVAADAGEQSDVRLGDGFAEGCRFEECFEFSGV